MKHSYLAEYADTMSVDTARAEKIKQTKKRKRVEEAIAIAILMDDAKRAVELAEKYSITPQEFGKMVKKYSRGAK